MSSVLSAQQREQLHAKFDQVLDGLSAKLTDADIRMLVKGVTDEAGNPIGRRGNSGRWVEVTTWKYVLGFLAPTLVFSALAVAWFSRRDL